MDVLLLVVLILSMTDYSSASWCVCRSDVSDTALQKTIDYACGAGADCTSIHQNGACYQPNTVRGHCSYAANSYYQRKGQAQGTCDFAGTAQVSMSDPSPGGSCTFPATPSAAGTSTSTPTTGTPTTTTPTTGTPTSTTPITGTGTGTGTGTSTGTTPTTTTGGIIGGIGSGLGPSGVGINSDSTSDGGISFKQNFFISLLQVLWLSGLLLLWG
ncbi:PLASMODESMATA CALLOSE-BINDING PROTEIN 3-like [Macadamia integrifolia]|uniref:PLASMODESMATA CALLOSE-BINDING PROTEIN 3-like n=1 Tax=Macadamia integrifolia TaxID=60698 RepID=UPI001C4F186C|nr:PLASMODESMATA CALLOSE-BINDING PROTEIN 3-like [Macadamia integrifolia]